MNNMLVFFHIEKTGGVTINTALRRYFGIRHCDVLYDDIWDTQETSNQVEFCKKVYPDLNSIAGHALHPGSISQKNNFQFTFLRAPVERCFSHYQHQVEKMGVDKSFKDWVSNIEYQNFQLRKISQYNDLEHAKFVLNDTFDFVGLTEKFQQSVKILSNLSGNNLCDSIPQNRKNKRKSNQLRKKLKSDSQAVELCKDVNKKDIKLYNYVKGKLFPSYNRNQINGLGKASKRFQGLNEYFNRLYRNLIYKPMWRISLLKNK